MRGKKDAWRRYHRGNEKSYCGYYTGKTWVHENNGETYREAFNSMGTLLYYPKSLELPKYCCSVYGGTNIQLQAWIDPNNNNRYIEDTEDDECWCEDCQGHTKIKKINE